MPLLQLIWTGMIIFVFFTLVFWIAWYIALPLLLIWGGIMAFSWLKRQYIDSVHRREANGFTLHRTHKKTAHTTVIDVDYTEVP